MTIIIFILVLLVTVTVHEWGHYITAKKSGMLVEEFGFGIPPRLFSWKKGETTYSINALPIGGFVKIAGENGLDEGVPANRQFDTKPWYLKSLVLVAGVLCNVVLAFVLFAAAYSIGMPSVVESGGVTTIIEVPVGKPAAQAGLMVGDVVTSIQVGETTISPISTTALREAITTSDDAVSITYERGDESYTAELIPEGVGEERRIGLGIESIATVRLPLGEAIKTAFVQTFSIIGNIFATIGTLVAGLFTGGSGISLMGPVGLAREVGSAATIGFTYLLAFTAMISANLAVLNILPFPALDGGRLLVVLLEAITRRRFSKNVVNTIHATGFLLLIGLMVYLTVGDIGALY